MQDPVLDPNRQTEHLYHIILTHHHHIVIGVDLLLYQSTHILLRYTKLQKYPKRLRVFNRVVLWFNISPFLLTCNWQPLIRYRQLVVFTQYKIARVHSLLYKVCAACLILCLRLVQGFLKFGQLNWFASLHLNIFCTSLLYGSSQSFGSLYELGTPYLKLGRWQRKTRGMTVAALSKFLSEILGLVHVGLAWNVVVGGCRAGHV